MSMDGGNREPGGHRGSGGNQGKGHPERWIEVDSDLIPHYAYLEVSSPYCIGLLYELYFSRLADLNQVI